MRIAGLPALVALRDHLPGDTLSHALVEDEILPPEFIGQAPIPDPVGVFDDPAFQVVYVPEAIVEHPCAGLFTSDTPGAIHDDVCILSVVQHIHSHGQLFPEGTRRDFQRAFKVSHLVLIMIAHVHEDGTRRPRQFIERFGIQVLTIPGHVERRVRNSVRHDLGTYLDFEDPKGLSIVLNGHVQS
jgi:hypothetical protein